MTVLNFRRFTLCIVSFVITNLVSAEVFYSNLQNLEGYYSAATSFTPRTDKKQSVAFGEPVRNISHMIINIEGEIYFPLYQDGNIGTVIYNLNILSPNHDSNGYYGAAFGYEWSRQSFTKTKYDSTTQLLRMTEDYTLNGNLFTYTMHYFYTGNIRQWSLQSLSGVYNLSFNINNKVPDDQYSLSLLQAATVNVTNYSFCMAPEPATISLLAIGGLALLRKRK